MTNIEIIRNKIQNINIYISKLTSASSKYLNEAEDFNWGEMKKYRDALDQVEKFIMKIKDFVGCYRVLNKDNLSVKLLALNKKEELINDNCEQGTLLDQLTQFENFLINLSI